MVEVLQTGFAGLLLIKPKVHGDHRGYFIETYNQRDLQKHGVNIVFVQDNQSFSRYGTLRGLHFQFGEHAQTKLIRAVTGRILDAVVDLRPSSETFGKVFTVELSEDNHLQLLVPQGFAHGFAVLSETATVSYKCDRFYEPGSEVGIYFADPDLNIQWGIPQDKIILSDKDKKNLSFREVSSNEKFVGHWR